MSVLNFFFFLIYIRCCFVVAAKLLFCVPPIEESKRERERERDLAVCVSERITIMDSGPDVCVRERIMDPADVCVREPIVSWSHMIGSNLFY